MKNALDRLNLACRWIALAAASVLSFQVWAATPDDSLLSALSSCKSSFFAAVEAKRDALSAAAPVARSAKGVSFIAVLDRRQAGTNWVRFSPPVRDGDLTLIGYFDEQQDLGALGQYYAWGFIALGDVRDVLRQVAPDLKARSRLRLAGDSYARSDLWVGGRWWPNDYLDSDTAPARGAVERVFLIEDAAPDFPGTVRIECSLQGGVTPSMLATERPDL